MLDTGDIVSFERSGRRYVGRVLASGRISKDPLVRYFCLSTAKFYTANVPWNAMGRANAVDAAHYLEQAKAFNARSELAKQQRRLERLCNVP